VAAEGLFATVFPAECRLCDAPLLNISRVPVCPDCLKKVRPIEGATCQICGERLLSPHGRAEVEARCGLCRRVEMPFLKAAAYGGYDAELRDLIHLFKYQRMRPVAQILGHYLAQAMATLPLRVGEDSAVLVPVPLHAGKLRERGFNQAEEIARAAMEELQQRGWRLALSASALERQRGTVTQTGLTRHQRRANVRGAFRLRRAEAIAGRDIILVDDVYTTGTTLMECARVLRRAGAARLWVVTVARVLKGQMPALPQPAVAAAIGKAAQA